MKAITIAEAIVAIADGKTLFTDDARCRNKVEARNLAIKWRPRLQEYHVTYKVALWWRSFKTRNADMQAFYLAD